MLSTIIEFLLVHSSHRRLLTEVKFDQTLIIIHEFEFIDVFSCAGLFDQDTESFFIHLNHFIFI